MTDPTTAWRAAFAAPPADARLLYSTGEAFGGSCRHGNSTLRLFADGALLLERRLGARRRAWEASADPACFGAVWAAVGETGFPEPPGLPIPPGGARTLIARAGELVAVVAFPRGDIAGRPALAALAKRLDGLVAGFGQGGDAPPDPAVRDVRPRHAVAASPDKEPDALAARWVAADSPKAALLEALAARRSWLALLDALRRREEVPGGSDLRGIRLGPAELPGAQLAGACLRRADLATARLAGADLEGADLRDADLASCRLQGARLRGADLRGASLLEAGLEHADLRDADLRGADLRGADLRSVDLFGARLRGALLRTARLDPEQVVLPQVPPGAGPPYRLSDGERAFLGAAFAAPFPVEQLHDTERFRGFLLLETLPDGQLLLRAPSRAFVRVGVMRGFAAAWVAEEGQGARDLDRLLSARFSTLQAGRLVAALQRGADLEDALAAAGGAAMPTIVARTPLPAGPGRRAVAVHFEGAGSVVVELEADGTILLARVLSGAAAFDLRWGDPT